MLGAGSRIAALLENELEDYGATEVKLVHGDVVVGSPAVDALRASTRHVGTPRILPLADWRARAMPPAADEVLASFAVDAADPAAIGALSRRAAVGIQPVVRAGRLLILPNDPSSDRVLLRSVQCAASDPVSFAVLDGLPVALFPEVPGWSALDCALRAVREHRAWLAAWPAGGGPPLRALDLLLTATRASLFLQSVRDGDPALPLAAGATVALLSARHPSARSSADEAFGAFSEARKVGTEPPAQVIRVFREVVERLPGYAATL